MTPPRGVRRASDASIKQTSLTEMVTRQLRRQKVTLREAFAGRDSLRYGRRDAATAASMWAGRPALCGRPYAVPLLNHVLLSRFYPRHQRRHEAARPWIESDAAGYRHPNRSTAAASVSCGPGSRQVESGSAGAGAAGVPARKRTISPISPRLRSRPCWLMMP